MGGAESESATKAATRSKSRAMINWQAFDWASFATLVAGTAAVVAAAVIGRQQIGIGRRQADIADAQRNLQASLDIRDELHLRSALFDRRFQVYYATRRWLLAFVVEAAAPSDERERAFREAMELTPFLFDSIVYDRLDALWRLGGAAPTPAREDAVGPRAARLLRRGRCGRRAWDARRAGTRLPRRRRNLWRHP